MARIIQYATATAILALLATALQIVTDTGPDGRSAGAAVPPAQPTASGSVDAPARASVPLVTKGWAGVPMIDADGVERPIGP